MSHLTTLPLPAFGFDCTTWRGLYAGCRDFTDALMEHVHIENNVLFPRFATR